MSKADNPLDAVAAKAVLEEALNEVSAVAAAIEQAVYKANELPSADELAQLQRQLMLLGREASEGAIRLYTLMQRVDLWSKQEPPPESLDVSKTASAGLAYSRFPFSGHTAQVNGRLWYWQLNIVGGGAIAYGKILDAGPAAEALEAARQKALKELMEQLSESAFALRRDMT